MLPEFVDPQSFSTAQSENARRKVLRDVFGEMFAAFYTTDPNYFKPENLLALADVLDDLTPDEIAEWMTRMVYELKVWYTS